MIVPTHSFLGMPAVLHSQPILDLFAKVEKIAKSNATVLLCGESGSGKELVARALHHYSLRSARAWVDINCAALPDQLVENELFGHERGALNGAEGTKPGLFEMASGGTLFLDEIGDLDPRLQTKLFRVLDGAPFFRLGGTQKVQVDVRIVAATNRNLGELVREGKFREDLYHRLAQVQLTVPPLRERIEDVEPLAKHFLSQNSSGRRFTRDAIRGLEVYSWPGNVRELRNVVLQCDLLAKDNEICTLDLPEGIQDAYAQLPPAESDLKRLYVTVNEGIAELSASSESLLQEGGGAMLRNMEKQLILQVLRHTGGQQERAAQLLGVSPLALSDKLQQYEATDTNPKPTDTHEE